MGREERDAIKARALARGVSVARLVVGASLELPLPNPDAYVGSVVAAAAAAPAREPAGAGRAQVNLKLSAAERDELRVRAAQRGVSVSELLLDSALERPLPPARRLVGPQERAVIDDAVGTIEPVGRRRARGEDRTRRLSVRLSARELRALRERARGRGLSVTRLLVDASLEVALPEPRAHLPEAGEQAAEAEAEAAAAPRRRRVGGGRAQVNVKLSATELEELRARAGRCGVSVSALLVNAALERPLPAPRAAVGVPERAVIDRAVGVIDDLIAELGRIGNNINQLAHVANISGDVTMERRLRDALGENSDAIGVIRGVADDMARSVRR